MNRRSFLGAASGAVIAGPKVAQQAVDAVSSGPGINMTNPFKSSPDKFLDPTKSLGVDTYAVNNLRAALGIATPHDQAKSKFTYRDTEFILADIEALKSVSRSAKNRIYSKKRKQSYEQNCQTDGLLYCAEILGLTDINQIKKMYEKHKHLLDIEDRDYF